MANHLSAEASPTARLALKWSFAAILINISTLLIVFTELGAAIEATFWAISGLLGLPSEISYWLYGIGAIVTVVLTAFCWRRLRDAQDENDD